MTTYLYEDRYRFAVRKTLNGYAIWAYNLANLAYCEATPRNLEMMDGLSFPEGYATYFTSRDKAQSMLKNFAEANNMTATEGGLL